MVLAAVLAVSVAAASGCEVGCKDGFQTVRETHCAYSGAVQVTSPTFALPPTVDAIQAVSCMGMTGTCGPPARVLFFTDGATNTNSFSLEIQVAPDARPGTYALDGNETGPIAIASYLLSADYRDGTLAVLSGEVVITRNDGGGFAGTFTIEAETYDGLHHVSLTGGSFQAGDCFLQEHMHCSTA